PADAARRDPGAARRGALAVPHRRALLRRGDHRSPRHPPIALRLGRRRLRSAPRADRPSGARHPALRTRPPGWHTGCRMDTSEHIAALQREGALLAAAAASAGPDAEVPTCPEWRVR